MWIWLNYGPTLPLIVFQLVRCSLSDLLLRCRWKIESFITSRTTMMLVTCCVLGEKNLVQSWSLRNVTKFDKLNFYNFEIMIGFQYVLIVLTPRSILECWFLSHENKVYKIFVFFLGFFFLVREWNDSILAIMPYHHDRHSAARNVPSNWRTKYFN